MNPLGIIFLVILLACVWQGYVRGLFQSLLTAVAIILAMALSSYACPYVSKALQDYTKLDEQIENYIIEQLELDLSQETNTKNEQMQFIDELPFPDAIKIAVVNNNNSDIYDGFQVQRFQEYVAHYLSCMVMNCLAYVVIQVMLTVGFLVLIHIAKWLTGIPILYGIDKTGGVLLGMLQTLTIIWSLYIVISLFGNTPLGIAAFEQISNSPVLNFLYEHNLIMDTITNVTNVLLS